MTAYELVCAERAIRDRAYLSSFRQRRRLMRLADDLQTIRETLADCDAERRAALQPSGPPPKPSDAAQSVKAPPPNLGIGFEGDAPPDLCMDDTGRPR